MIDIEMSEWKPSDWNVEFESQNDEKYLRVVSRSSVFGVDSNLLAIWFIPLWVAHCLPKTLKGLFVCLYATHQHHYRH